MTNVGEVSNGAAPVDFYVYIGNEPIEASLVVGILTKANPQQIGAGYEVIP